MYVIQILKGYSEILCAGQTEVLTLHGVQKTLLRFEQLILVTFENIMTHVIQRLS